MISQYFTHTHTDRFASSHDKFRKEDSRNYLEPLVLVLWLFFSFAFVKPSATGSEARVVF
jgi:hypothetical protein